MFIIKKKFKFEAGHQLTYHEGKCSSPHGHSYEIEVVLRDSELKKSGPEKNMVLDFYHISKAVRPLIESHLDHKWLNDTLETDSPTAEFIAHWIFHQLKPQLPLLYKVSVWETQTSKVSYTES
ncbi:MAG: 6-carboxytetrahydropterin synthase QueD [Chlamydiales bacterium]|nr:6-carboxytetrahydropterin synthase QueD [Chlamydiales bacterium]NCF70488.1 6-carboxytetrahydropterin synthase QueD [Chlamydiales bacterium]